MATDRRTFLGAAAALALLGPTRLVAASGPHRLLSCRSDAAGRHFATLFDERGDILMDVALPGRGHGIALSADEKTAAVFARRPGDFLLLLDLDAPALVARTASPAERHFMGHGAFSADGGLLFASENAFETGAGRVGIYDVRQGLRRLDELDSHGIGPHEIRLMDDGCTLAVANGGIRTHPDMPRAKLNLDSMRSALAYLDIRDGRLLGEYRTPERWQRLSIRHLDVSPAGQVALALQYEGAKNDRPPLVAVHGGGDRLRWLNAPPAIQARMRNYCGSVAFLHDGSGFVVSSPRGGLFTRWSSRGDYLGHVDQPDVCGIASDAAGLWSSDGHGGLRHVTTDGKAALRRFDATHWDNHLRVLRRA